MEFNIELVWKHIDIEIKKKKLDLYGDKYDLGFLQIIGNKIIHYNILKKCASYLRLMMAVFANLDF